MTKEEITNRWLQSLWVEQNWKAADFLMSDDFEILGMQPMAQGTQSFLSFLERFLDPFEDLSIEVTRFLESEDAIAAQFRFQGTHSDRKRDVDFVNALFLVFERGVISRAHVHFDSDTMWVQLGVSSYHRLDEVFEAKD